MFSPSSQCGSGYTTPVSSVKTQTTVAQTPPEHKNRSKSENLGDISSCCANFACTKSEYIVQDDYIQRMPTIDLPVPLSQNIIDFVDEVGLKNVLAAHEKEGIIIDLILDLASRAYDDGNFKNVGEKEDVIDDVCRFLMGDGVNLSDITEKGYKKDEITAVAVNLEKNLYSEQAKNGKHDFLNDIHDIKVRYMELYFS